MLYQSKRIACIFIVTILIFCSFTVKTISAQTQPNINSPSALLIDAGTGTTLYEKNPQEKVEPASITKIMTLILVFDAIESGKVELTDIIRVSERAWQTGGSQAFLGPGERQTLETLLKCIIIASANDASMAVAEHIGGSVEGFVKLMNEKARELGMVNTHFANPHGLSSPDHYTTAYDIGLMSKEIVKYPLFFKWSTIWMDYLEHTDKQRDATMLANTNKLLGKYEGLDGLKTGFHSKAGHCFAGTAKRGDFRLISVVLNAENSDTRFEETMELLNYGFGHYNSVQVVQKGMVQKTVPIEKGHIKEVNLIVPENINILVEKGKEEGISTELEVPDILFAPLKKDETVGNLIVKQNDETIKKVDIVISEDISKANLFEMFKRVLGKWFLF